MALEDDYSFITPDVKKKLIEYFEIVTILDENFEGLARIKKASANDEYYIVHYDFNECYIDDGSSGAQNGDFMKGYLYIEDVGDVVKVEGPVNKSIMKQKGPPNFFGGCLEIFDYDERFNCALCQNPISGSYIIVNFERDYRLRKGDSFTFRGLLSIEENLNECERIVDGGKTIWVMAE